MKVIITGGHISPAISVIESKPADWEVFFVGRKSSFEGDSAPSLEYQIVKSLGVPFIGLPSARLQRKFTLYTVPSLAKLPYSLGRAVAILRSVKPDVVLGFGGYISFPICLAARLLRIPVVIHEQTLGVGAANKMISKWARMVCVSWPNSKEFFPGKNVIHTGNPIRREILEGESPASSNRKTIYITGGSTGSHFINNLVHQSLEKLLKDYTVIHQAGDSRQFDDYEKLEKLKKELPKALSDKYILKKFTQSDEIREILDSAALIIGRAGINTVTELIFLNKPCLLIPLPFSGAGEQLRNALFIKELGLGEVLEQDSATPASFVPKVTRMMDNIGSYKLTPGHENLIEKRAAEHIISVVNDVAEKKE